MDKWNNDILVRGKPLMTSVLSKAMTTGADEIELQVPDNERWLVKRVYVKNGTLSAGDLALTCELKDQNDVAMGKVINVSAAATVIEVVAP